MKVRQRVLLSLVQIQLPVSTALLLLGIKTKLLHVYWIRDGVTCSRDSYWLKLSYFTGI